MESGTYTKLKVLKSAAGYYIGRGYLEPDVGFEEPGTRESGYFATEGAAEVALATGQFSWRAAIENESFYERWPEFQNELTEVLGHSFN